MKLFTWLTASVSLLSRIHSKTVDESLTGALLTFPDASDGPLFNKTFEVAPAQFGYQAYGGTMKGQLVLPANETFHKECPRCSSGQSTLCDSVGTEPAGLNPYIHYIQDWFIEEDDITDYIMVIDRQDCYFVNKIEFAQQLGASGVIICDYQPEHLFTMWMPQDWNDDIDIPAVLLSYDDCRVLMAHLGVTNWSPTLSSSQVAQMGYPTPESMNWTVATIEWGLPHPDDMVEYDLWTSSNDYLGSKFKHNFNETAIRLDLANDTIFTPHMYILNGSHWMCDEVDDAGNPTLPCGKQCTNSGRYCAVDPEYDITIGLDGSDVIQENLRSLCVWEFDKEFGKNKLDDIMWWDYAVLWDENCGVYANSSMNFHAACSYQQMDALKPDGSLSAYVQQCIVDSGGYGDTDGLNTILKRETRLKYNQSIYAVPLVAVNGFLIHGNIDCEPPVTAATCEVLAAICAGFVDGTQPDVCYVTPAPTVANCTQADRDCAGTCFGSYQMDACDQCLPISSHDWNKCIGCNGNTNGTQFDCEGTCGGHYAVNPCGYCKDTRHAEFETFGIDCNGGCEIDVQLDECGECLKLSDEKRNACFGCDGVKDSGKELNACGMCELATDPNFDTYGRDCTGNCTSSYMDTRYEDKCGQCLLPTDSAWNSCVGCDGLTNGTQVDCAGVCGGHYRINPCGYCKNTLRLDFETFGVDCNGGCELHLQFDECGKCLNISDPQRNACIGCDDVKDSGKKWNVCGVCAIASDPNFDAYGRDCTGNCVLSYVDTRYVDSCGQCLLPTDPAWNGCTLEVSSTTASSPTGSPTTASPTTADSNSKVGTEKDTAATTLTTLIAAVCVAAVLIIVAVCLVFRYLYRKQQQALNQRFDVLAATYVHMDENPKHSIRAPVQPASEMPSTLESVPDQEEDDD